MLWNVVRDFFVSHIFGGITSQGVDYGAYLNDNFTTLDIIYDLDVNNGVGISLGDYLSTIATIICMVVIVLLCCLFIKTLIKLVFRLFTLGGSF